MVHTCGKEAAFFARSILDRISYSLMRVSLAIKTESIDIKYASRSKADERVHATRRILSIDMYWLRIWMLTFARKWIKACYLRFNDTCRRTLDLVDSDRIYSTTGTIVRFFHDTMNCLEVESLRSRNSEFHPPLLISKEWISGLYVFPISPNSNIRKTTHF